MPTDSFTRPDMAVQYMVDGRTARTRNVPWGHQQPRAHRYHPERVAREQKTVSVRRSDAKPAKPAKPAANPMLMPGWLTQQCVALRFRGVATWDITGWGEHELTLLINLIHRTPWVTHTTYGRAHYAARDTTRKLRALLTARREQTQRQMV